MESSTARAMSSERLRPHPHVISVRHGDSTALLDVRRGQYYALKGIGGRIWELLCTDRPISDIVAILGTEYDASPDTLLADVTDLLGQLQAMELVAPSSVAERAAP